MALQRGIMRSLVEARELAALGAAELQEVQKITEKFHAWDRTSDNVRQVCWVGKPRLTKHGLVGFSKLWDASGESVLCEKTRIHFCSRVPSGLKYDNRVEPVMLHGVPIAPWTPEAVVLAAAPAGHSSGGGEKAPLPIAAGPGLATPSFIDPTSEVPSCSEGMQSPRAEEEKMEPRGLTENSLVGQAQDAHEQAAQIPPLASAGPALSHPFKRQALLQLLHEEIAKWESPGFYLPLLAFFVLCYDTKSKLKICGGPPHRRLRIFPGGP